MVQCIGKEEKWWPTCTHHASPCAWHTSAPSLTCRPSTIILPSELELCAYDSSEEFYLQTESTCPLQTWWAILWHKCEHAANGCSKLRTHVEDVNVNFTCGLADCVEGTLDPCPVPPVCGRLMPLHKS